MSNRSMSNPIVQPNPNHNHTDIARLIKGGKSSRFQIEEPSNPTQHHNRPLFRDFREER